MNSISIQPPAFLVGGGDMGRRMRAFDWDSHAMGQPAGWPEPLQTLVALMLNANHPMYIAWGEAGFFLYNDAYAALMFEKHPGGLARPLLELWAEVAEPVGAIMDQVFRGEAVHQQHALFMLTRRGQPEESYFSFSMTPIRDRAGNVAGLFCACVETTDQVLTDRRRADETERQRRLFARAPGFITILHGPAHVYEFVNESYLQVFGARDFVGKPIRDVFPELEGQGFFEWLDKVYTTGERFVAHDVPIRLQAGPGAGEEQHYLDFIYEPMLDEAGECTGIFCEGYDVTETHLAHRALSALNEDLERQVADRARERGLFWSVTPDLLGVANADGFFEKSNPSWLQVLGWNEAEISARPLITLVHPDDVESTLSVFAQLLRGEPLVNFENRYLCKDGSYRWLSWTAVPEEGRFYCNGRDITEEKHSRLALDEAQTALRQAQKMEAIGQLTGGIAHDFNNLLGGISASLQVLQARIANGRTDGMDRYIGMGQDAVRRAASLTHRLLAFSRRQTLDPKPIDVNLLIVGMEELVRRTAGTNIALAVLTDGGLWPSRIDVSQLENSLLNLCLNARDSMMPDGGRLTIETANERLDEAAAEALELPPGEYISISVSDTGSGMSPEVAARVFEPFYTTKPIGQGTGLGLSMVYGFVRQSGGQIHILSEPDRGTTMRMYLPRFVGNVAADAAVLPRAPIEQGEGETVLLIEDEGTIRELVTEVLQEAGYRVIAAGDGPAGLALLRNAGRIDLLVTDVGLPGGLNGRQVADAARTTRTGLKVLFITGYAENAAVGNGLLDHGMAVITKPFELAVLASKVRQMIES